MLADPPFDALPALVEANRTRLDRDDVTVGGLTLRELRALARREVLELATEESRDREGANHALPPGRGSMTGRDSNDAPLILAGHQPELSHPGVWVKNFALNGARPQGRGHPASPRRR